MENHIPVIDLHMHSTFSDGTDTPEEILANVKKAGIDIFSLTDHDESQGAALLLEYVKNEPESPAFLTGAEFSCRDEYGRYHILGHNYDPESPSMKELTRIFHDLRIGKVKARVDMLRDEKGFEFSDEDLTALFANKNPGKPHIGNLMVKYGYAPDRSSAIDLISKLPVKSRRVRPEEAIEAITKGGGIPTLAHGFYGDGDQLLMTDELEERVARLKELGLRGLECFYSGFSEKMINTSLRLANKYGLLVTAGSDYHGANKLVRIGDTGVGAHKEEIFGHVRPFLEACAIPIPYDFMR